MTAILRAGQQQHIVKLHTAEEYARRKPLRISSVTNQSIGDLFFYPFADKSDLIREIPKYAGELHLLHNKAAKRVSVPFSNGPTMVSFTYWLPKSTYDKELEETRFWLYILPK